MKIDEIFKDMPNLFGIADDILVAVYKADGRDHDETVQRVLQRSRQVNVKLNKDKCHFRYNQSHSLGRSYHGMENNQGHRKSRPGGKFHPQNKKFSRLSWVLLITWVHFLLVVQVYETHFKS